MLPINPKIKLIGRREFVDFPLLEINKVEAKIDTGAYTCAIHCNNIILKTKEGKQILTFQLLDDRVYQFEEFTRKKIKTTISLSDRENMRYPVLIGRRLLKGKFIIDVNLIYTNGLHLNTLLK